MLINPDPSSIIFEKTSGVTTIGFPYAYFNKENLKVAYTVSSDPNHPVYLVYGTDYTVSPDGPVEEGNVTLIADIPTGATVEIFRETPKEQLYNYRELDDFPAESHENGLSKIVLMTQENAREIAKAIKVPYGSETTPEEYLDLFYQARDDAQAAAVNSANSATASASSASASATSATASANSATAANSAKTAAETARTQAQTSATAAATSATNAANSATASAGSASAAATARTGAETARSGAETRA